MGREVFQPAGMVFLTAFALNTVRLLLLSGIGKPYDPVSYRGNYLALEPTDRDVTGACLFPSMPCLRRR